MKNISNFTVHRGKDKTKKRKVGVSADPFFCNLN